MEYKVIVTKKNIKNIILKVKHDGTVTLSVPHKVPITFINNFLEEKKEWILKNLEKIKKNPIKTVDKSYKNGENIEYLGNIYTIKIFESKNNKVFIEDNFFNIFTNKEITDKNISNLIYSWYKKEASNIFLASLNKYSKLTGLNFLEYKIRKMKSRWGSCRYLKKSITLNIELIKKSIECIDYVAQIGRAHV